jgi:hypothetical protein
VGLLIDYLSARALGGHLEAALEHPIQAGSLPIASIKALMYTKLLAKRRKDLLDITALLKAGAGVTKIRQYLSQYAGEQLPLFETLLQELP